MSARTCATTWLVLMGACALVACSNDARPWTPRVVCHNSNCVEPPSPDDDDTLASLEASLALRTAAGGPLLDGAEIDTFWHGATGVCLFAHDLDKAAQEPAAAAAALVLAHLRNLRAEALPLTPTGLPFAVQIELKGQVGLTKAERHDDAQRRAHAACALDLLDQLAGPAVAEGLPVEVTFTSFVPALLGAVRTALDARPWRDPAEVGVRLGAIVGLPAPLDSQTQPPGAFSDALGVSVVTAHPQWTSRAQRQAFDSRGWELGYWMFSAVPETYALLARDEPSYITTNEAQALRRWLAAR